MSNGQGTRKMEYLYSTNVGHCLTAGGREQGEKDIDPQVLLGLEYKQSRIWKPRTVNNKDTKCWLGSDSSSGTCVHKNEILI